jgi:hypothetical protein
MWLEGIMCCIDGCESEGTHRDNVTGRAFCEVHWGEECAAHNARTCDAYGCHDAGTIVMDGIGKCFCPAHAWTQRSGYARQSGTLSLNDQDMVFLKSQAISLDGDDR